MTTDSDSDSAGSSSVRAPIPALGGGDSVVEIAAAVAGGTRSVADVIAAHIERCRAHHGRLNALIQERFGAAAEEARQLADRQTGALAGVPVSVKECFPIRGMRTTLGIRGRRDFRDEADAGIVTRLRDAGAVVLGKGNVPQALYLHETDNPVWGRTLHPLAGDRGPGGSTGGDAALVAAGCVSLAVGNDLAGSIRQPAHACGIVGLVPRSATLGGGGTVETMPRLAGQRSRAGILTRTVADALSGFQGLCGGASGGDPPHLPWRIGWWDETGVVRPSPAVRRAVRVAISRLQAAGATVERVDADMATEAAWVHLGFLSADGGRDIRRLFAGERPMAQVRRLLGLAGVPAWARSLLAGACAWSGRGIEAAALRRTGPRQGDGLRRLFLHRDGIDNVVDRWRGSYDCLVCPVSALPALRHGTAARLVLAAAPCLLANLLDLAAGSVPVTTVEGGEESGRARSRDPVEREAGATDRGSAGLPVGVQVIALDRRPIAAERIVLDVMGIIEGRRRTPG